MAETFGALLHKVVSGSPLTEEEAQLAFSCIMAGETDPVQLGAFLSALKVRGETTAELTGAVKAVRSYMTVLPYAPEGAIDVCGTGGDGLGTLNVSTAVAFVLAGLGVPVAKHGNRAASSMSGATDVLEKLGIPPNPDAEFQARCLTEDHLAFLSAPHHHPALKHATSVRRTLGFRTLFNLLGPLCNPAQVHRQLIGVFDGQWCLPVARTLGQLGSACVWAVHGTTDLSGSDELTLAGPATIAAWEDGKLFSLTFDPQSAGFPSRPISAIRGDDPQTNAEALLAFLDGADGAYRETVLLNAAAALHVAGRGNVVKEGRIDPQAFRRNAAMAARSIDDGLARTALERARQSARFHKDAGRS
ncbi:anthranilate phosphoribosyltransferase [Gluconobacter morbifer]|uniref:Anthranilate phosphoribosyltransferase n=1 Tax=Gluconobacter morbifer G707 TaxID=1088869 RepID=G6XHU2_9PROT|nr:anthranilate phosphoribosyltransferase [Gluconobacter morbifer]EHH68316.1 anthranilate phosphoribosyltransferase [Gluconobacter morbifer G707]